MKYNIEPTRGTMADRKYAVSGTDGGEQHLTDTASH